MINDATDRPSEITRDFADIYQQAATFINEVNDKLAGENVFLTLNLPQIRSNRRPTGIESETSAKHFEISCHPRHSGRKYQQAIRRSQRSI